MARFLFFLVLIGAVGFFGYRFWEKNFKNKTLEIIEVEIAAPGEEKGVVFQAEAAKTIAARTKGLMFRESLDWDRGMIFVFEQEAKHWIWMKNTKIPLDIIFINSGDQVVEIVERAEPESLKVLGGGEMSLYVLEINGGLVEEYGINIGDKVKGLEKIYE